MKSRRGVPDLVVLGDNHRNNGGQPFRTRCSPAFLGPDAHHVGQHPQGHEAVFAALVFAKKIKMGVFAVDLCGEEEIRLRGLHLGVNEGTGFEVEAAPVHKCRQLRVEVGAQKSARGFRVRKRGAEKLVVGLVDFVLGHRAGAQSGRPRTNSNLRKVAAASPPWREVSRGFWILDP